MGIRVELLISKLVLVRGGCFASLAMTGLQ